MIDILVKILIHLIEYSDMRKISATMASQHPDHAGKPFWHDKEFISAQDEIREAYLNYSELGIDEYKWDWEGKLVDESVLERMWGQYYDYFKKEQIGRDKFLTFRLPNPKVETEFRLGRAFMGILSASGLARQVGLHTPPLFEVILPMTESAQEMIDVQAAFAELSGLKHKLLRMDAGAVKHIELIPLFESVDTIMKSDEILHEYLIGHRFVFGSKPSYIRPYVARSDPALNAGLVPTVLAIKIALSRYARFEHSMGVKLYPIIGSASLPFRGGLTPDTVTDFAHEYSGIRTALIQSGFRYDYPKESVISAIAKLSHILPRLQPVDIPVDEERKLRQIVKIFSKYYRESIENIADEVNKVASKLPKRRERVQHIGLFGYSRGLGKVRLPRAIGFTAAMYSLGMPPEIIGTGRGLRDIRDKNLLPIFEKYYLNFRQDITRALAYANRDVVEKLAKKQEAWRGMFEDIGEIEKYIGYQVNPKSTAEVEHYKIIDQLTNGLSEDVTKDLIVKAGILRKSLG